MFKLTWWDEKLFFFLMASCHPFPQIRMRDDALPLAHIAIAVEGASIASPDIVPLMVANAIVGSYDLTYGGGKVGFFLLLLFSSGTFSIMQVRKADDSSGSCCVTPPRINFVPF